MTNILTNSQGKAYISSGGKALLSTGGGSATLITKTITQNGTYNASSDNADGYSSVIVNVGGTPTPTGKYQLFERIKDDNNLEIGTVCGFFKDANDVEYAVVCLDAQYRLASAAWSSSTRGTVTNLTEYIMNGAAVDLIANTYTDTATSNCDKILAWCTAGGYTSAAVSHCRSKSFVIGGITYYGQLPNLCELFYICANRAEISNADTSKSSYSSLDIATLASRTWSSSQFNSTNAWQINTFGAVINNNRTYNSFVAPVLELPNAL